MSPLIVTLHDFPDIDAQGKQHAERKFLLSLEKSFPDTEDLLACFKAFQNASDSDGASISKHESRLAMRFQQAFDKARQAGFQQLGTEESAYFDVRLA